jgi:hypothetical protein
MTTHEMMIKRLDVAPEDAFWQRRIAAKFVAEALRDESQAAATARVDGDVRVRAQFEMLAAEAGLIVDALGDATFDGDVERAWSLVKDLDPEWVAAFNELVRLGLVLTIADAKDIVAVRETLASLKDAVRRTCEIAG